MDGTDDLDMGKDDYARSERKTARPLAAALLATTLLLGLATGAQGQIDAEDIGGTGVTLDTDYTPVAKEYDGWQRVAGADFGADHVDEGSTTTFGTDLYTVVAPFGNSELAFAGGAACRDEPTREDGESLEAFNARVSGCNPRVPVVYRFSEFEVEDPTVEGGVRVAEEWQREELPGGDAPGYVGQIAFIDSNRVVAVGGTGEYVRRERSAEGMKYEEWVEADPAEDARAWLWERSSGWREFDVPDGMRGLTAVGFAPPGQPELGYAGGLGQLWEWREGRFTGEMVGRESPYEELFRARLFRYRVRGVGVEFGRYGGVGQSQKLHAFAVTAGCCDPEGRRNAPLVLHNAGAGWEPVRSAVGTDTQSLPKQDYLDMVELTAQTGCNQARTFSFGLLRPEHCAALTTDTLQGAGIDTEGGEIGGLREIGTRPGADSYYDLQVIATPAGAGVRNVGAGVLAAPGGPESEAELDAPKLNVRGGHPTPARLSTARFVAFDGTIGTPGSPPPTPRWTVGLLRSSDQALAESTHLDKPGGASNDSQTARENWGVDDSGAAQGQVEFDPDQTKRFTESYNYFKLPAYALNAVEMVEPFGIGWAVGERGAILKFGDPDAALQAAPRPPSATQLRNRKRQELPSAGAYEAFRAPPGGPPGAVPALAGRPDTGEPGFVSGGWVEPRHSLAANAKVEIEMSRDGSEGWALESAPGTSRLYRFDGEGWSLCDPVGLEGQLPADEACVEARVTQTSNGQEQVIPLMAIARVPLEYDSDPTNDDELEIVGITGWTAGNHIVLRYRQGRWRREGPIPEVHAPSWGDLAFATPDDGFFVAGSNFGRTFYDYNGTDWIQCKADSSAAIKERCGDAGGLLAHTSDDSQLSPLGLSAGGKRLYLWGARLRSLNRGQEIESPQILHRDPDGQWTADLDPEGRGEPWSGAVDALAVTPRGEALEGWALATRDGSPLLLRLGPGGVEEWSADDASAEYLSLGTGYPPTLAGGGGAPFVFDPPTQGPLLAFDEAAERWRVLPAPFLDEGRGTGVLGIGAETRAMAPDGQGGFWAAVWPRYADGEGIAFQHYVQHVPEPVFAPAAQPLERPLRAIAATPDGQVWLAEDSGLLAHYDRVAGWETVKVPGWDTQTTSEEVNALALGPDGRGIAVGNRGRIAELDPAGVQLDPAAGTVCTGAASDPPCGTSRNLNAAAIAPDGSAIAAGDNMSILWRPAGGEFRSVGRPLKAGPGTHVTAVALPRPDRAYLATASGEVYEGDLGPSGWRWRLANTNASGELLSVAPGGRSTLPLRAIAVGADGRGYAVGDEGLLLKRTGDAERPWRRLRTPHSVDLTAVALPAGGGPGALVGGEGALVLTLEGHSFRVARPADPFANPAAEAVGLALTPGTAPGQVEAWAALSRPAGTLLYYSSEPADPLLDAAAPRADALPDAPAARPGELSFAAFGKTDCTLEFDSENAPCSELAGTDLFNEEVLRGIIAELGARASAPAGARFALFTGDVPDRATDSTHQNRFIDLVAEPLDAAGAPLFGAVGGRDVGVVDNADWRAASERRPVPWGTSGEEPQADGLSFEPAPGQEADEFTETGDGGDLTGPKLVPGGQGRTHYAVDVFRDEQEDPVARIVVVDTSSRSLVTSDPHQQPLEPDRGQQGFLERMLCFRGDADGCTREPAQQAIVLSNAPTYSYGPGAGSDTATDGALLESILLRYRASVLVTGRLGWQGRYWATAPGLHEPCPGDPYQPDAAIPEAGGRICGRTADLPVEPEGTERTLDGTPETPNPQAALGQLGGAGILPVVVSSTAGGKLAEPAGEASDGYWHGYSVVRLDASGDPRATIVEQRPIFDWVQITAPDRTLLPRQRVALRGVGREPYATDATASGHVPWNEIDSYAITHRYDLLLADPEQPWLPNGEAGSATAGNDGGKCGPYLCLPERVGMIDSVTGEVRAGDGKYPDTFALATLSLGCVPEDESQTSCSTDTPGVHSATYPLVFKKSPSFVANAAFTAPATPSLPTGGSSAPAPPPPPNPSQPSVPQPSVPQPPAPPTVAALPAAQPPEPQPPVPPAPPPPAEQPSPLNLTLAPPGVAIATPTAVIQPPTPPVNPAPPGGARREARQRQAAAQKSGADSQEEGASGDAPASQGRIDDVGAPNEMTRREGGGARQEYPMTRLERAEQPSAWAQGALYTGGLGLMALVMALGWSHARPTPRRRGPELAAPALSHPRSPASGPPRIGR